MSEPQADRAIVAGVTLRLICPGCGDPLPDLELDEDLGAGCNWTTLMEERYDLCEGCGLFIDAGFDGVFTEPADGAAPTGRAAR